MSTDPRPGSQTRAAVSALCYLLAITIAEVLAVLADARIGVTMHAVILLALLWHGSRSALAEQRLYWSLVFAPLIRMLSLSLPLDGFPVLGWYDIISVVLFVTLAAAARTMGFGAFDLGLRWRWRQLPLYALLGLAGCGLGIVEYQILHPVPLVQNFTWSAIWAPALILLISTGFAEELIFRGLMQRTSSAVFGPWLGLFLPTAVFTVLHVGYKSWTEIAFVFLAGGLFAVVARWMRNIWGVSLAHGMASVSLLLIWPFVLGPPAL